MDKTNKARRLSAPIVELLEPRVLFSADSLSALSGALLSENLTEHLSLTDIYPDLELPHPLDADVTVTSVQHTELVFVDSRVPELQSIVDDITMNKGSSALVVVVDNNESGIELVKQTLQQFESVDAIHIVSHSLGSSIRLGSDFLTTETVQENSELFASWGDSLSKDADLLIYGCDLGSSENGIALMNQLAAITGADVAASTNDTGHISQGGDWVLEKSTGLIETEIVVSKSLQKQWEHVLASWNPSTKTLIIDYTDDRLLDDSPTRYDSIQNLVDESGAMNISLREAIVAANAAGQSDITIQLSNTTTPYILDRADNTSNPDEDLAAFDDLDVSRNITIEGLDEAQTIIQGNALIVNNEMRLFDVRGGATLSLSELTVTGGIINDHGGAIRVIDSKLNLTGVTVASNRTLSIDPTSSGGGGIYALNSAINFQNTTFTNNSTDLHGGGLHVTSTSASITPAILDNVTFTMNQATENGGGLYTNAGIAITLSEFQQNDAKNGGAIYTDTDSVTTISDTDITNNNQATNNGGGIFSLGELSLQDLSLVSDNIAGNNGGGILASGSTGVYQSNIENNLASNNDGGGIHSDNATLTIRDSNILGNQAPNGSGGGVHGGGDINVYRSTVANNTALQGGGVNFIDADLPNIVNTTFVNNTASNDGGAIFYSNNSGYLENNTIAGNTALGKYGAIGTPGTGASVFLKNNIISANVAEDYGNFIDEQQLAPGTTSMGYGYNVIASQGVQEIDYIANFNDIIGTNLPGYTVDAGLSNTLESHNGSHSMHLRLQAHSDAVDAGGSGSALDAYGIARNEFVDAGAVEFHTTDPAVKLYWIDQETDANAIYRMNENGRALQQIIAPQTTDDGDEYEYLDVAYDSKSDQLFFIRLAQIPGFDKYEVVYASADGIITAGTHLSTTISGSGGIYMPDPFYRTDTLAIEETADPNAPNILYLGQRHYITNSFRIISFDIIPGVDGSGAPNIWLDMITNGAGAINKVSIMEPDGGHDHDLVTSLNVVSDPNLPGEQVISWADEGIFASADFVVSKKTPSWLSINAIINGNAVPDEDVTGIAYDAEADVVYVMTSHATWKFDIATGVTTNEVGHAAPKEYNDIEFDANSRKLWFADAQGVVGSFDEDLNLVSEFSVQQTPFSVALAKMSAVNTPPRVAVNSLSIIQEGSTLAIDDNLLLTTDVAETGATPDTEIFYTVTDFPKNGTLTLNGSPIDALTLASPTGHFTQQQVNDGELQYIHAGTETLSDAFDFIVSDNTLSTIDVEDTFTIAITPVNDAPVIEILNTDFNIDENTSNPNKVFASVVFSDADSANLSISLTNHSAIDYVTLNASNEIVPITGVNFDHETASAVDFTITVTDDAGLSDSETRTISVADINEAPTIDPIANIEIGENQTGVLQDAAGNPMLPISFSDVDVADTVSVRILEGGNPSTNFAIDANNRIELITPGGLNHETVSSLTLTIEVSDNTVGTPLTASTDVIVSIKDVNEAPNINSIPDVEIDENQTGILLDATGGMMPPIIFDDVDDIGSLSLQVLENGTPSTNFIINANNRIELITPGGLSHEANATLTLTIEVSDNVTGTPLTATADVIVSINDVNEAPTIDPIPNIEIDENQTGVLRDSAGDPMSPITFADVDDADTLSVKILEAGVLSTDFVINTDGRIELITSGGLNHENNATRTLTIEVSDNATGTPLTASTDVNVKINDVNEPPTLAPIANVEINENQTGVLLDTSGDPMSPIVVADVDEGDSLSVRILEGGIPSINFSIDANNRIELVAPGGLSHESDPTLTLTIEVSDNASGTPLTATTDVTVNINDVNEVPAISFIPAVVINENQTGVLRNAAGDLMSPIVITDVDDSDSLSMQVLEGGNPSTNFIIDANNRIELIKPGGLNHEAIETLILTIEVSDNAINNPMITTTDVTVTITNVNETPTATVPNTILVDENFTGNIVDSLNPYDPDTDDTTTLTLVNANNPGTTDFVLSNDGLILQTPQDYEANEVIHLSIEVSDGVLSNVYPIEINIQDVEEAPELGLPLIDQSAFETALFSHQIPLDAFTDGDGDALTIAVTMADGAPIPANYWLQYDQVSRTLYGTPTHTDVNNSPTLTLLVTASDNTNATQPTALIINLIDVNQAPSLASALPSLQASDAQEFTYQIPLTSFVDADNDQLTFAVGPADAQAWPAWLSFDAATRTLSGAPTDADTNNQVLLNVYASDGTQTSAIPGVLTINVIDANQNPTSTILDANVVPELTPNAIIGTLTTIDPDAIDTAFSYTVDDERFEIIDGVLSVKAPTSNNSISFIDVDEEAQITINITVTDSSDASHTSAFILDVENVNENPIVQTLPAVLEISAEQPFDLSSIVFVDPDNDPLSRQVTLANGAPLPEWLVLSNSTNTLSLVNTPTDIEVIEIAILVNDSNGGTLTETVFINIVRAPIPDVAAANPVPQPVAVLQPVAKPQAVAEPQVEIEAPAEIPAPVLIVETPAETAAVEEVQDTIAQAEVKPDVSHIEVDSASVDSIDLASLIKPFEQVNLIDIESANNTITSIDNKITIEQIETLDIANNFLTLADAFNQRSDIEFTDLADEFDRQREELAQQVANNKTLIGSSFTVSSGLSVGYLLWLIRGGTLMGSVLSSLPAWRLVDPLPVLSSLGEGFDDDDESLESMVDNQEKEPEPTAEKAIDDNPVPPSQAS